MDHFKHHRNVIFEGEYTRFTFPSGASLIIIICIVHDAPERPVNVNITYVPPGDGPIWQRDFWPDELAVQPPSAKSGLILSAKFAGDADPVSGYVSPSNGVVAKINAAGGKFSFHDSSGIHFEASIHSHTPWSRTNISPEGLFISLPLPLHWHVLSPYSPSSATLRLPSDYTSSLGDALPAELVSPVDCVAHFEKNWAKGFPEAHVWVQGHRLPNDVPKTATKLPPQPKDQTQPHLLTIAGGPIMGTEAYLVGYRNSMKNISLDFRPPFTLSVAPMFWSILDRAPGFISQAIGDHAALDRLCQAALSPFTSVKRDWTRRKMDFSFVDPIGGWNLVVEASALKDATKDSRAFYNLAAPYKAGFKDKWMAQCLRAKAFVKLYRRRWGFGAGYWPWTWELVCEDFFENVGFEFGGEYYPNRGIGER